MKIAVVAAHGKSGQAFVRAALASGHEVRAGIRGNNPFVNAAGLEVIQCDAFNAGEVEYLITGCDGVVSLIGHVKKSPARLQTSAVEIIAAAMKKYGIARIISLTGTGARQPGDRPSVLDKIMNFSIAKIDPARIADGVAHVKFLETTKLDWTVVRVLKLTGGHAGKYRLTSSGPALTFVSRATVAEAIIELLEQHSFVRGYPITS